MASPFYAGAQSQDPALDQVDIILARNVIGKDDVTIQFTADGHVANTAHVTSGNRRDRNNHWPRGSIEWREPAWLASAMSVEALVLVTVFFVITAVALAIQAAMLAGIYKTSREMQREFTQLMPRIESLLSDSAKAVRDVKEVAAKSAQILDAARSTVDYVDHTVRKTAATVSSVQSTVLTPLRRIGGAALGVKAALHFLSHRDHHAAN